MEQETQIQMDLVSPREQHMRELRINGPTGYGQFFIQDTSNRVFDGAEWRGFGEAERYLTYQEAFIALRRKALPAHIVTYPGAAYRGTDVIHEVDEVEAAALAKAAVRIEEERLYKQYWTEKQKWKGAVPFVSFNAWTRRHKAAQANV
jgi:hypothetical protein